MKNIILMCKNIPTLYIDFEQFKASKTMFLMISRL